MEKEYNLKQMVLIFITTGIAVLLADIILYNSDFRSFLSESVLGAFIWCIGFLIFKGLKVLVLSNRTLKVGER